MTLQAHPSLSRAGFRRIQTRQVRDPRTQPAQAATSADLCPEDCRKLWCAVMTEAWRQAFFPHFREGPRDVAAARRWFGTRDFEIVCGLMDVDPDEVMSAFHRAVREDAAKQQNRARR